MCYFVWHRTSISCYLVKGTMSSDMHCCVPGCKNSEGMHQALHGFPNPEKDKERFLTWLYSIGGDVIGLENEYIFKYRRVCHAHFEDKYLCRNNKISKIAMPTLNMPALFSRKRHSCDNELINQQETPILTKPSKSSEPNSVPSNYLAHTSMNVRTDVLKENVDPNTQQVAHSNAVVLEKSGEQNPAPIAQKTYSSCKRRPMQEVPNLTKPTNSVDQKTLETAPSNPPVLEESVEQNLGKKGAVRNTKRIFLTKKEKELYNKIITTRVKLSKMKNKIKKQAANIKTIKKLTTNPAVLDIIENCSSTAKLLMQIQWRENKKKEKGRRFTLKEKIAALSVMKQSPKGYRFLRKVFILPAQQTLIKLVQKSNLKPGINKNVFAQLKTKAETMKIEEKLCIIMFDEVCLKTNVTYQEKKDKITGLVDNGEQRKAEFADHAQVFMVRGLLHNYKQPVAYTFSSSATKGPELAKQIKEIVTGVQESGLIVVASVCDQGTNNRQALKLLLNETRGVYLRREEEPKENIILINDQEIIPLYDPPHLLKGMRNNLLTKNLNYTSKEGVRKTAKWSHLQLLHKENPGYKGIRLIPKLTENHINPERMNKMKVKYASQIFSRTVASNMGYLSDKGILPAECKETADLLLFMDNIFDSVNGSYKKNKNAKPLLGPATTNSVHNKAWVEGIQLFNSMSFVTSSGKKESVPTVQNWVWTLKSIQILLNKLRVDFNVSSVWLRHLNQDPLENFFGAVRSHGCRNTNPTCDQFESAFATLLINNLNSVHTRGKNCEQDFCNALHSLIINDNTDPTSTCTFDFAEIFVLNFEPVQNKENDPRIIAPLQYISGYFLKKAKSRIFKSCVDCKADLSSYDAIEYIQYREYAGRRWLCTPSKELIEVISNVQDIIYQIVKKHIEELSLKEIIKTAIIMLVDFKFIKCNLHKEKLTDFLINIVIRCLIFNYCKNVNKILAGRKEVDDDEDSLQIKAKKYNKCYKRRK